MSQFIWLDLNKRVFIMTFNKNPSWAEPIPLKLSWVKVNLQKDTQPKILKMYPMIYLRNSSSFEKIPFPIFIFPFMYFP